jgi:hypothetical protein
MEIYVLLLCLGSTGLLLADLSVLLVSLGSAGLLLAHPSAAVLLTTLEQAGGSGPTPLILPVSSGLPIADFTLCLRFWQNRHGPHLLFMVHDNKTSSGTTPAATADAKHNLHLRTKMSNDKSDDWQFIHLFGQIYPFSAALAPAAWHSICIRFQVVFPAIFLSVILMH